MSSCVFRPVPIAIGNEAQHWHITNAIDVIIASYASFIEPLNMYLFDI